MLHIKFRYKDSYSHWEWREQECVCNTISECIEWYGLYMSSDCDYEFISVEEV